MEGNMGEQVIRIPTEIVVRVGAPATRNLDLLGTQSRKALGRDQWLHPYWDMALLRVELARDGMVRDAGVSFSQGSAEVPNPWQAAWDVVESVGADVAPRGAPVDIEFRVGRPS